MSQLPTDAFRETLDALTPILTTTITPLGAFSPNGGDPIPLGTGTLFAVGSSHFIVTAAHVLDQIDSYKGGACAYGVGGREDLGTRLYPVSIGATCHRTGDPFDLALMELDEGSVAGLVGRRFLRLSEVSLRPEFGGGGWVAGFPQEYVREPRPGAKGFDPLSVGTHLVQRDGSGLADYDPQCHFLLNVKPDEFVAADGSSPASLPSYYYGISGCAVWQVWWPSIDTDWPHSWRSKRIHIVGVQTGHYRKLALLKATYWGHVAGLIHQVYPALRPVLEMHFGKAF